MFSSFHHPKDSPELIEVLAPLGFQLVPHEERHDALSQMLPIPHSICHPVSVISSNHATTEMGFQSMKDLDVTLVLNDGEFRQDLNSKPQPGILTDPDVKASFSVDKSDYPLRFEFHLAG